MKLQNDEKINIIILVTVMVSGLAFYFYKKSSKSEVTSVPTQVSQPAYRTSNLNNIAQVYKSQVQRVNKPIAAQRSITKRVPTNVPASAAFIPTNQVPQVSKRAASNNNINRSQSWNQKVEEPGTQTQPNAKVENKNYDESDEGLLNQTLQKALDQGSKVAYIGEVPDLYAFDSRFFESYVEANGKPSLRPRRFDSYQMVETSAGPKQMLVQREPYPVPTNGMTNYKILNFAIMKAADDGAMLINLASSKVDRNQLQDSIQYARGRGAVVVTVAPPGK